MQENEFEKQVKARIDGFRLRPSDPVWPNIREEIRDKRRRRLLLIIPLLAVLIGLGYFTWYTPVQTGKSVAQQKEILKKDNKNVKQVEDKSKPELQKNIIVPGKNEADLPKSIEKNLLKSKGDDEIVVQPFKEDKKQDLHKPVKQGNIAKTLKEGLANHSISSKGSSTINVKPHAPDLKKEEFLQTTGREIESRDVNADPLVQASNNYNNVEPGTEKMRLADKTPVVIDNEKLPESPLPSLVQNRLTLNEIPSPAPKPDIKRKGKIKWGIELSAGVASRFDHPFNFNFVSTEKSMSNSALVSGVPLGTGNSGSVAGGGLLVLPPSRVKAGAAFKIGFALDKTISKRLDISTGIQYWYSSDHISIGKTINTSSQALQDRNYQYLASVAQANYTYSSSSSLSQNYTNKYHFIELPVTLHFNLNRKWKTPFIWNAGIAISRLVKSNLLLYKDTWGGLYYESSKELSKTQFSLMTGLSIRFRSANRWEWNIGPQVSMNTTKLFESSADNYKHLVYGGLNLQLFLPGKKR